MPRGDSVLPNKSRPIKPTRRISVAAVVIDDDGNHIYRIIFSGWTKVYLALIVVLMLISLTLCIAVFINSRKIKEIEDERVTVLWPKMKSTIQ